MWWRLCNLIKLLVNNWVIHFRQIVSEIYIKVQILFNALDAQKSIFHKPSGE